MYLLDTNAYIRYLTEFQKLPERLLTLLDSPENELFVSAVVPWEIAIKHAKGKLPKGRKPFSRLRAVCLSDWECERLEHHR